MNKSEYLRKITERNIGIFTTEEQEKINNIRIGVAGVGGVGGIAVERLVRMGIGAIKIADPDIFEYSNINRQFGSTKSSLGKNKSLVIGDIVKDINPYLDIEIYQDGVNDGNVKDFVNGCDFVIDGIDYNAFKYTLILHKECRNKNIFVLNPHAIGFGSSILIFDPTGMSIWEYIGLKSIDEWVSTHDLPADKFCPVFPSYVNEKIINRVLNKDINIPTVSPGPAIAGSIAALISILFLLKRNNFPVVPKMFYFDIYDKKIVNV